MKLAPMMLRALAGLGLFSLIASSACSSSDASTSGTSSATSSATGTSASGSTSASTSSSSSSSGAGGSLMCGAPPVALFTETVIPAEDADFIQLGMRIQGVQETFHQDKGAPVARGFHAKSHACVLAQFEVLDDAFLYDDDPDCKAFPKACPDPDASCSLGVFGAKKTYKAWIRFSNGLGYTQSDSSRDVRGLAIKVMGVPGKKLLSGEETATTQDFLMTNAPTPLTDTADEFMDFAEATTGQVKLLGFLATHLTLAQRLNDRTSTPTASMLDLQYWSGTPYRLGRRAMKFTVRPHSPSGKQPPNNPSDDYLREDIVSTLKQGGVVLDFSIQLQASEQDQPLEQPTIEWKESLSPFVQVARITIAQQDLTSPNEVAEEAFCNSLGFQPWHSLPEHRPLSSQNRARKVVYEASRKYRAGAAEPTGNEF